MYGGGGGGGGLLLGVFSLGQQLGIVLEGEGVWRGSGFWEGWTSKRAGGSGLGGWPPVQMISPDLCLFDCVCVCFSCSWRDATGKQ